MLKELMKLAEKKKGKGEMDPTYKSAKMGVLGDIKKLAEDSMKGDIEGLKKVTVASSDEEGLKEGLEKAKDMVGKMPGMEEQMAEHEAEMESESPEMEASEEQLSKLSPEEQAMLAKLLKKMA